LAIVLSDDWLYTVPCTISLGIAFYLVHNTVQTKATEVAPDARASALALYAFGLGRGPGRSEQRRAGRRSRRSGTRDHCGIRLRLRRARRLATL